MIIVRRIVAALAPNDTAEGHYVDLGLKSKKA
jgi:hypothetical protein